MFTIVLSRRANKTPAQSEIVFDVLVTEGHSGLCLAARIFQPAAATDCRAAGIHPTLSLLPKPLRPIWPRAALNGYAYIFGGRITCESQKTKEELRYSGNHPESGRKAAFRKIDC